MHEHFTTGRDDWEGCGLRKDFAYQPLRCAPIVKTVRYENGGLRHQILYHG